MVASFKTAKRLVERARKILRDAGELNRSGKGKGSGKRKDSSTSKGSGTSNRQGWNRYDDAGKADGSWRWADKQPAKDDSWRWDATSDGSRHWADTPATAGSWSDEPGKFVPPPPKPVRLAEPPASARSSTPVMTEPARSSTASASAPSQPVEPKTESTDSSSASANLTPQPSMKFALYSAGLWNFKTAQEPIDITVEAHTIRSNSTDTESWACAGMNGAIMLEVATHPATMQLIQKMIADITNLPDGTTQCNIMIKCHAGRHRSVALLTLVADALENASKQEVSFLHVSEASRPFCGCPSDCKLVAQKAEANGWQVDDLKRYWLDNGMAAVTVFRRLWATAVKRQTGILM